MSDPFSPAQLQVIRTMVTESIDAAFAKALQAGYTSGVISSVSGPDALVEPDDAPGTLIPATVTNASDQTTGARVVVWHGPGGTSYVVGVVP
jgi:hypothetical protein